MTRLYAVILVVTVKDYESKLTLPLTTGHGMSALHVRQAVWIRVDQLPGNLLYRRFQNTLLLLYLFKLLSWRSQIDDFK